MRAWTALSGIGVDGCKADVSVPFHPKSHDFRRSINIAFVYTKIDTIAMKILGFDWDEGNWPKCGKHGVSQEEIEEVLMGTPSVMSDPNPIEPRMRAIGKTQAGRYVFLVFMPRKTNGKNRLRPISARYMHQKEINHYEKSA
jgi:uncharacterized protein